MDVLKAVVSFGAGFVVVMIVVIVAIIYCLLGRGDLPGQGGK